MIKDPQKHKQIIKFYFCWILNKGQNSKNEVLIKFYLETHLTKIINVQEQILLKI